MPGRSAAFGAAAVLSAGLVALAAVGNTAAAGGNGEAPAPGCLEETVTRVEPVVSWHADRYAELEVEDLYKLLHQAVAGPGHAIESTEAARDWLEREWAELGDPGAEEVMIEPLSADERLVRVNLRPWRAAGGDPNELLVAFVQTAAVLTPSPDELRTTMESIRACSGSLAGITAISATRIDSFFAARSGEGYPAVHHSSRYAAAHEPAYRVVLREFLD